LHNRLVDNFGSDLRRCDLDGIRVSETLMPAGLRLAEHAHDSGQICFVLEGAYRERLIAGERQLRAGMVHIRAPHEPHANEFAADDDALTLLISIDARRWIRTAAHRPLAILGDLATEIRAEIRRGDESARAALEGLSMLALSRLARVCSDEPEWLGDAASWIDAHFAEPLSLARVARAIGVGRSTLSMAFRRWRGTSVGDAIRRARVAHAKLLIASGVPLVEVAYRCGFSDQAHFTRVFRDVAGLTPGAYAS
jgi:AraC family transcriptional regulator